MLGTFQEICHTFGLCDRLMVLVVIYVFFPFYSERPAKGRKGLFGEAGQEFVSTNMVSCINL